MHDEIVAGSMQIEFVQTQQVIASTGVAIANRLDNALAAGNEHDVRVELTALYQFFADLKDVFHQLEAIRTSIHSSTPGDVMLEIIDDIEGAFGGTIPGVHAALQAAEQSAMGSGHGLGHAMKSIQAVVARNLRAVHDTYIAYLNADSEGARALSAAVRGNIDNEWQSLDPTTSIAAPLGLGRIFTT